MCLVGTVRHSGRRFREEIADCFTLFCYARTLHHSMFIFPFGVIGRLFSVTLSLLVQSTSIISTSFISNTAHLEVSGSCLNVKI